MDSPISMTWVERYRPKNLDSMALEPEQRALFSVLMQAGEIPHLLLTGPPGCGKTTMARMLVAGLDCDLLSLNASKERGIDLIREKIGTFAKVYGMRKWKVVFLDEADGLTPDAQNALRNMMEDYHEQTRFIFTANNKNKIISPIQSRCTDLQFGETPFAERLLILERILTSEGVVADRIVILGYAERYHDLRKMITAAQTSVLSNGGQLKPASETVFLGTDLLKLVRGNEWNKLVAAASHAGFDHQKALKDMFWAVEDGKGIAKPAQWRYLLAKATHESGWTPDIAVHFLGTCAELISMGVS